MSGHVGVSCDKCLQSNFTGKRFKCLICYDYDLCEHCFSMDFTTSRHLVTHPMQCILTKKEFGKYYGGESITPENPPSLTCPLCGQLGFTQNLLYEHVTKEHENDNSEVICPICAALPSGDPNLVTQELLQHLSVDHHLSQTTEDILPSRHFRRRGVRSRHFRNSYFSGSSVVLANNASSSNRDSRDPISVLLSQLSGVRHNIQLPESNATNSQIQEIFTPVDPLKQPAADVRRQLERFPNKVSASAATPPSSNVRPSGGLLKGANTNKKQPNPQTDPEDDSRFLLNSLDNLTLSEAEKQEQKAEDVERSQFVQELLLSMLVTDYSPLSTRSSNSLRGSDRERAVPIECPVFSVSAENQHRARSSFDNEKLDPEANLTRTSKPSKSSSVGRDGTSPSRKEARSSVAASLPDSNVERNPATTQTLLPQPPTGVRHQASDRSQAAIYDDEKDEDKPPLQQSQAIRVNDLVYATSPVRTGYGQDNFASDTVGRNVL